MSLFVIVFSLGEIGKYNGCNRCASYGYARVNENMVRRVDRLY